MTKTRLIALILVLLLSAQVKADITVTDTNDSGAGSLRAAILAAAAGDTIQFASSLAGKTITLASTLPSITKPLTIVGLGASQLTIDDENRNSTVFTITANGTATISGLTITSSGLTLDGGGIYNAGSLAVRDCVLSANDAVAGGGIYFDGEYGGTMTVTSSVFSGNSASFGGGIYYSGTSGGTDSLTVTDCVFSGNSSGIYTAGTATISGCSFTGNTFCGIRNYEDKLTVTHSTLSGNTGGGIHNDGGTLVVNDSTIAQNSAEFGGGIYNNDGGTLVVNDSTIAQNSASNAGGGIDNKANATLWNTIVADNHNGTSPDIYSDIYNSLTVSYCLVGNTLGATISSLTNILNTSPDIAWLGSYGGPTMPDGTTMLTAPPLPGSPAIDKGSNALIPSGLTTDQRGLPRIANGRVDIGACEYQPVLRPMTVDLNHDGIPNFYDFSIFATFWQNASCSPPDWCDGSDFDKNGIVDIYDLQIFAEFWLWPVADVDMDGAVNFTDYAIFAHNWTDDTCCDPNWCEGTDFDHSGSVDMLDLATFTEYWLEGI